MWHSSETLGVNDNADKKNIDSKVEILKSAFGFWLQVGCDRGCFIQLKDSREYVLYAA